eukprot:GHVU01196023.1.p1 GENE.GHVU01196023.1~~GHVU01196023.1.p1  ORF type:complete len:408 (+),score=58.68 GHVU01196023.1:35-1225(+)
MAARQSRRVGREVPVPILSAPRATIYAEALEQEKLRLDAMQAAGFPMEEELLMSTPIAERRQQAMQHLAGIPEASTSSSSTTPAIGNGDLNVWAQAMAAWGAPRTLSPQRLGEESRTYEEEPSPMEAEEEEVAQAPAANGNDSVAAAAAATSTNAKRRSTRSSQPDLMALVTNGTYAGPPVANPASSSSSYAYIDAAGAVSTSTAVDASDSVAVAAPAAAAASSANSPATISPSDADTAGASGSPPTGNIFSMFGNMKHIFMLMFFLLLTIISLYSPNERAAVHMPSITRRISLIDSGVSWPEIRHLFRVTWDYRLVNECLDNYAHPMPDIEENLTYVNGARVFAVIDMIDGFNQCPLHENSREIFSILVKSGIYTPKRVPQGSKISPAYFQQVME